MTLSTHAAAEIAKSSVGHVRYVYRSCLVLSCLVLSCLVLYATWQDWAIWDIAGDVKGKSTENAQPVNLMNAEGKPVDRQGRLCSTVEPPAKGLTQCPCSRYSGEGFGVHCGTCSV